MTQAGVRSVGTWVPPFLIASALASLWVRRSCLGASVLSLPLTVALLVPSPPPALVGSLHCLCIWVGSNVGAGEGDRVPPESGGGGSAGEMSGADMRRFSPRRAVHSASCFDSEMAEEKEVGEATVEDETEADEAATAGTPALESTLDAAAAALELLAHAAAAALPAAAAIGFATFHFRMNSRLVKSASLTGVGMRLEQQEATIDTAVGRLMR